MFNNLNEALNWLYEQKKLKKREDLSRIGHLIKKLNIKFDYKIVHIAGTNGKGSTASFIKKMLQLNDKKVGLFVSPFVIKFNERIQINDEYIKDEEIISYCNYLHNIADEYSIEFNDTIPFFELTFLMSLLYFDDNDIDYLVLECGMGGLLDSTNIVESDVQVITNIGYDHIAQLGPTLADIANHKLGITRPNKKCFTATIDALKDQFIEYSKNNNSIINFINDDVEVLDLAKGVKFKFKDEIYHTSLNGSFQAYNASLAISVVKELIPNISKSIIDKALDETYWPGRFEYIKENIIIDGAHNIHGVDALVETLKNKYPNKYIKVVFTALQDKSIDLMLSSLDQVTSYYYFTSIIDKRATDVNYFKQFTNKEYILIDNYIIALDQACEELKENELLVITGSLHFISNVIAYFKG